MTRNLWTLALAAFLVFSVNSHSAVNASVRLYSHAEFLRLNQDNRVAYIQMIREILIDLESDQARHGTKYGRLEKLNWLRASLFDSAWAATVRAKGRPCVFAGNMSTYASTNPGTCVNEHPCGGDKRQIECNPLLFGKGLCVAAREGATARCLKNMKVNDEDLAKELSEPDRAKDWNEFKSKFDDFCADILNDRDDVNYNSCRKTSERIKALEAKLKLLPPASPQTVNQSAPAQLQLVSGDQFLCEPEQNKGCLKCPPGISKSRTRPVREKDLSGSYGDLLRIMAASCKVKNESDTVVARTLSELVNKFGVCESSEFDGVSIEKYGEKGDSGVLKKLIAGDSEAHQELSGGFWNNANSQIFQRKFGLNIREARQVFCSSEGLDQSVQVLMAYPESYFAMDYHPTETDYREVLDSKGDLSARPKWMNSQNQVQSSVGDPLRELNQFRQQTRVRRNLASCLQKNDTDRRRRFRIENVRVARPCVVESVKVNHDQVNAALAQMLESGQGVCVEVDGQAPVQCTHLNSANGEITCNKAIPEKNLWRAGGALSRLRCSSNRDGGDASASSGESVGSTK